MFLAVDESGNFVPASCNVIRTIKFNALNVFFTNCTIKNVKALITFLTTQRAQKVYFSQYRAYEADDSGSIVEMILHFSMFSLLKLASVD